jgi:hypothetical protein
MVSLTNEPRQDFPLGSFEELPKRKSTFPPRISQMKQFNAECGADQMFDAPQRTPRIAKLLETPAPLGLPESGLPVVGVVSAPTDALPRDVREPEAEALEDNEMSSFATYAPLPYDDPFALW